MYDTEKPIKPKIALVTLGGTIGSTADSSDSRILTLSQQKKPAVLQLFEESGESSAEFTVFSPVKLLSENADIKAYQLVYDFFRQFEAINTFDGVIVTHGTDTLAYFSAFLGLILQHVKVPVVITAANIPPLGPNSDALSHFSAAVAFIRANICGVFVAFGHWENGIAIHYATKLRSSDPFTDEIVSADKLFGYIKGDAFTQLDELATKNEIPLSFEKLSPCVQLIRPYPTMNYDEIPLNSGIKAVVHTAYHSGTACTTGEGTSILSFIARCRAQNIDFYFVTYHKRQQIYTTTSEIIKAGATLLFEMTEEYAFMKALLAYHQNAMSPSAFMTSF